MLERVCFLTNYNQYQSKRHFTKELSKAFEEEGVESTIFDVEDPQFRKMPHFKIHQASPDLTISFNSFVPSADGKYLWEQLKIPHLSILVDPALYYMDMVAAPYSIVSVVDRSDVEGIKSFGKQNVFFLPHGASRELAEEKAEEKEFDVVFIGSCYDYLSLRERWQEELTKGEVSLLEESIEIFLNDNVTPLHAALAVALSNQNISPKEIDFMQIFRYLDIYTRGLDRIRLIRSIKDAKVHVFGGSCEGDIFPYRGWQDYLSDMANVTVHNPVDYEESHRILKRSRISLNSSPFFKTGSHERLFVPPLLGALVVANDTVYTRKEFIDGRDIILYPPKGWSHMNDRINAVLKDPTSLEGMVRLAKEKVLQNHTWNHRARTIKEIIPKLLTTIAS
ncbi:glycosyltransferase family protein [Estrella lausannensis]|uniref:Spore protein YkvP/CgeB glycosyl transferase-like domain-containing protein n=1 Tax=Estrella lausannensis TaxID=483423 RepID=A0A0H5DNB4_9BACT|nr:glycosyltransferase [Estrella lausannensis]CRX37637.1 hypothetical protein ELAC_0276 [Estrella lausannensis]